MASAAFYRALDRACPKCARRAAIIMRGDVDAADIGPYSLAWRALDACANLLVTAVQIAPPRHCPLLGADVLVIDRQLFERPFVISQHVVRVVESKSGRDWFDRALWTDGTADALIELELARSCAPSLAGYRRG